MSKIIYFSALLLLSVCSFAEDRIGKLYEIGKTDKDPLFIQKTHVEEPTPGHQIFSSSIVDSDGKLVMTEKAVVDPTGVISQQIDQLQIEESYELERKDDLIIFRTFSTKGGARTKTEESTEKVKDNFITGPMFQRFLMKHATELSAGKSIDVAFGVFELGKSVGFTFSKKGLKTQDGASILSIKMALSSFFLSMFVDSIYMDVDVKDFTLIHYKGRTPVRRKVDGKWKAFDSEIVYSSPTL
jgi:hypothetical protein